MTRRKTDKPRRGSIAVGAPFARIRVIAAIVLVVIAIIALIFR